MLICTRTSLPFFSPATLACRLMINQPPHSARAFLFLLCSLIYISSVYSRVLCTVLPSISLPSCCGRVPSLCSPRPHCRGRLSPLPFHHVLLINDIHHIHILS